ncbi:hypothetical protein [Ohtaekwangia sp.]|uniref:hypothetical protein n=1 Tax=Ohtaekwangia sp. TaxID=2066019 RepID=UPI002FDD5440
MDRRTEKFKSLGKVLGVGVSRCTRDKSSAFIILFLSCEKANAVRRDFEMKTFILIGLTFLTFSCVEKQGQQTEPADSSRAISEIVDQVDNKIEKDNCNAWLDGADSTLSTGDYLKYIKENGRIKIKWGSKDFTRTLNHSFDCDAAPHWIPTIRWTTSKYIGLGYGCGSPCWGTIILPLNSRDSVFETMYDFEKNLERSLVVYLDGEDYDKLTIENWATGEKQEIKARITCESAFLGYCIDSIKFVNDDLYIKWDESAGQRDNKKENVDLVRVEI